MIDERVIFDFERDFAGSLRCIPMIVRFKLDLAGVKLSLRQWSKFTHADRDLLVKQACESEEETAQYRTTVIDLIEARADEPVKFLAIDPQPEWSPTDRVPEKVTAMAKERDATPPTVEQWAALPPLERFTLLKLTRDGHDNANFVPALKEILG